MAVGGLGPNATGPSWAPRDVAQKCARLRSRFWFSFDYQSIFDTVQMTSTQTVTIRTRFLFRFIVSVLAHAAVPCACELCDLISPLRIHICIAV